MKMDVKIALRGILSSIVIVSLFVISQRYWINEFSYLALVTIIIAILSTAILIKIEQLKNAIWTGIRIGILTGLLFFLYYFIEVSLKIKSTLPIRWVEIYFMIWITSCTIGTVASYFIRQRNRIRKDEKMKEEQKKVVRGLLLSLLLFVVTTVWFYIVTNFLIGNLFLGVVIIALPFFIIPLFFIKENNFEGSIIFGALVGFIGGTFFLICWMVPMVTAPDPNADYSLAYGFWVLFTLIFTGSSIAGSMLSYLIRKIKGGLKK